MELRFVKTHEDARLPQKNHPDDLLGDAGYDLFAVEDTFIEAGQSAVVPVGLKLGYVTAGYWFRIEPRSGLGFKKHLQPHLGIIDNGYRGDLGVKIYNFGDKAQEIKKGTGVAQFIVYKMIQTDVSFIDEADETERGEKGFGSSDE
jgi:dUTP pyrophosphatase